jgi:hypothetical protein
MIRPYRTSLVEIDWPAVRLLLILEFRDVPMTASMGDSSERSDREIDTRKIILIELTQVPADVNE